VPWRRIISWAGLLAAGAPPRPSGFAACGRICPSAPSSGGQMKARSRCYQMAPRRIAALIPPAGLRPRRTTPWNGGDDPLLRLAQAGPGSADGPPGAAAGNYRVSLRRAGVPRGERADATAF
jgi:hypothetical protein